jgi:hypothetical protein
MLWSRSVETPALIASNCSCYARRGGKDNIKIILKKWEGWVRSGFACLRTGSVTGFCARDNEPSDSIKCGVLADTWGTIWVSRWKMLCGNRWVVDVATDAGETYWTRYDYQCFGDTYCHYLQGRILQLGRRRDEKSLRTSSLNQTYINLLKPTGYVIHQQV